MIYSDTVFHVLSGCRRCISIPWCFAYIYEWPWTVSVMSGKWPFVWTAAACSVTPRVSEAVTVFKPKQLLYWWWLGANRNLLSKERCSTLSEYFVLNQRCFMPLCLNTDLAFHQFMQTSLGDFWLYLDCAAQCLWPPIAWWKWRQCSKRTMPFKPKDGFHILIYSTFSLPC